MTTPHPITPPPELVQQWFDDARNAWAEPQHHVATRAAQWGADQELEACCEVLRQKGVPAWSLLRLHRRPKPPSLKEQALEWLIAAEELHKVSGIDPEGIIRRALEAIPDD